VNKDFHNKLANISADIYQHKMS